MVPVKADATSFTSQTSCAGKAILRVHICGFACPALRLRMLSAFMLALRNRVTNPPGLFLTLRHAVAKHDPNAGRHRNPS